ncbi:MAG: response regulator transcription factor [Dehalococcoidales bacterium]
MSKITVLIADDHAVLRGGLKALLDNEPDMKVISEASDGREAVEKCGEVRPDVVLMDITMPGLTGIEATKEIKERYPSVKILVLTMHEDTDYLRQVISAGADGFIPKKAADTELLAAIRATHQGERFLHPLMTSALIDEMRNGTADKSGEEKKETDALSERERAVLQLLALGHTNQQVADQLFLSVKTIESYKSRLKVKLGLNSRVDMIKYAMNSGLLDTKK